MAYHRIGRDDDHWETTKDDEDEDSEESSTSFVNSQPLETPVTYPPEAPARITDTPTLSSYFQTMSERPSDGDFDKSSWLPTARPTGSFFDGRPSRPTDDYDTYNRPQISSTLKTAYGGNNGLQSSTLTATTTRPVDDASSPPPADEDPTELQNHGADNGPNRGPMFAAAGIMPVLVIIIGFLVFYCLRKRRRQRQTAAERGYSEEMRMRPKSVALPYLAPITPPSPPPAVLPHYSSPMPSSSHPPTASSSQPVILGPIPSGNNGAYMTGMDTSDHVSMTSAGGVSRQGTVVDRDPFADGRSLEEAPPPYRPSSLPPVSIASTSRNNSIRVAATLRMTTRTQLVERSPFDDPQDDDISENSGPTLGRSIDAISDVSDFSYQVDSFVGRSPL